MKKLKIGIALLALFCLGLTGCGKNVETPPTVSPMASPDQTPAESIAPPQAGENTAVLYVGTRAAALKNMSFDMMEI